MLPTLDAENRTFERVCLGPAKWQNSRAAECLDSLARAAPLRGLGKKVKRTFTVRVQLEGECQCPRSEWLRRMLET